MMKRFFVFVLIALFATMAQAGEEGGCCGEDSFIIGGFVDASYGGNLDTKLDGFSLDQVEIDITRHVNKHLVLRADLETTGIDGMGGEGNVQAEQGYLAYNMPFAPRFTLTFGKFNAPMGFEMLDAPDMYQFSHSYLFNLGLPTNLTGAMIGADIIEGLTGHLWVVNGWDLNADPDNRKNFGGRLNFAKDAFQVGASAIMGSMDNADPVALYTTTRRVIDVDGSFTGVDNLIIGGELNMGTYSYDIDGADDDSWMGIMVMGHYDVNDWLGFTLRYDMMQDKHGIHWGLTDPADDESGQTRSSITLAPTFVLGPGMGALVEYRMFMSDEDVFVDHAGEVSGSTSHVFVEFTYTFGKY